MANDESILDHPELSARIFYPWPKRFPDPFYVEVQEARLGCRYSREFPDGLTMIHFHGNGETVADYVEEFAPRIASFGANLLLAEYRGYGMSNGEPKVAAMLADIPAIVAATGAETSRLVFFGRSLGSIYAVHAASLYPEAAGLVLESGIADPLERILLRVDPWQMDTTVEELRAEVGRVLNQKEKLAAFRGRTLVMHTMNDDIVPVAHGVQLHEWTGGPKELVVFERGDHNNIMEANREAYFGRLEKFLHSCEEEG
ncbi:MAG TPA: alpha/beta fold hydrolase [Geobacteraceae bacterium]|nr:alpha/beta fold hydrolase [Geobacteraceae bacterium]